MDLHTKNETGTRTLLRFGRTRTNSGLTQDGLVRPDEHVALVDCGKSPAALAAYMAAIRARKAGL